MLNSLFIPRDDQGSFLNCHQYDIDLNTVIGEVLAQNAIVNSTMIEEFVGRIQRPLVQCTDGWDYDTELYPETLASKVRNSAVLTQSGNI